MEYVYIHLSYYLPLQNYNKKIKKKIDIKIEISDATNKLVNLISLVETQVTIDKSI